jgi:hypothetical protein
MGLIPYQVLRSETLSTIFQSQGTLRYFIQLEMIDLSKSLAQCVVVHPFALLLLPPEGSWRPTPVSSLTSPQFSCCARVMMQIFKY